MIFLTDTEQFLRLSSISCCPTADPMIVTETCWKKCLHMCESGRWLQGALVQSFLSCYVFISSFFSRQKVKNTLLFKLEEGVLQIDTAPDKCRGLWEKISFFRLAGQSYYRFIELTIRSINFDTKKNISYFTHLLGRSDKCVLCGFSSRLPFK